MGTGGGATLYANEGGNIGAGGTTGTCLPGAGGINEGGAGTGGNWGRVALGSGGGGLLGAGGGGGTGGSTRGDTRRVMQVTNNLRSKIQFEVTLTIHRAVHLWTLRV